MKRDSVRNGQNEIPPGWRKLSHEQKRLTLRVLLRPEFAIYRTEQGLRILGPGLAQGGAS